MESGEGGGPMVTEQDIANIVAQWTGIPIEKVLTLCRAALCCAVELPASSLHGGCLGL
jgi:ATP-dependent Clp protease ATP-binding subunit ClpA